MAKDIWGNDSEEVSECDRCEEVQESDKRLQQFETQNTLVEQPQASSATDEMIREIQNNSAFELNDQEADTIHKTRLRLEQAKLYEMLINHNLFEGVDINPQAIKNVQNELKEFIVERLEILMGIKAEKDKLENPNPIQFEYELPFNAIEIEFLKQLAYKGTKGTSATIDKTTTVITSVPSTIKPVTESKVMGTLKPLTHKVVNSPLSSSTTYATTKKVKSAEPPKKRITNDSAIPRSLTPEETELLAKQDIKELSKIKPWDQMTAVEKENRIKEVNNKHKKLESVQRVPMPTPEELEQKYLTEQSIRMGNTSEKSQLNSLLIKLSQNKIGNIEENNDGRE
ncbi:MAG: hypothetical protein PHF86_10450 [Candidatus Nanoarchaeia archaeon]|nr:hypothetical protein [Candidatus Nanoarchaeia archaeon]